MLKDKVALVTGGGSGIGKTTALAFSREGAIVVIADVNATSGQETMEMIKECGGEAVFVKTDVSIAGEVQELINTIVRTYGRLNCAFNNAGVTGITASTTECTEDKWDYVIDVNLKGTWLCMRYEIPVMLRQGGGAIVNTSSILGTVATEDRPAYVASKHGVIGLTKAAALEYSKQGVRVNAVCPGPTRTGSAAETRLFTEDPDFEKRKIAEIPMGRFGESLEIAEAVIWLCSDAASFVTGLAMNVDGGLTSW